MFLTATLTLISEIPRDSDTPTPIPLWLDPMLFALITWHVHFLTEKIINNKIII